MHNEKQKTIKQKVCIEGIGLHTGKNVKLVLMPADLGTGILFIRSDLQGHPSAKADLEHVLGDTALPRCTSIGKGKAVIHTVEHLMAALYGLGIDNLRVEIDAEEMPGLDGSSVDFYNAIREAGIVEQDALKQYIELKEPIWLQENGSTLFAIPADHLMVSYTLDYGHTALPPQFFSSKIDRQIFEKEIVSSRTFCLEDEAQKLRESGLGKGANYKNTLVVTDSGVKDNQVRFVDEFARHKVLDFIGDLYLLGKPVKAHIVGIKSGHNLNRRLLKKIMEQQAKNQTHLPRNKESYFSQDMKGDILDIHQIKQILPHRYPFLFIDRVIEVEPGKRVVAIKNVTSNESFFQGHFPQKPIMPGVIMVEAMAQAGGIAVLTSPENKDKLALFMAIDKVKFRKIVEPGDQLVFEVTVTKSKSRVTQVYGIARVEDKIVAEADLTFSFTDITFLNN